MTPDLSNNARKSLESLPSRHFKQVASRIFKLSGDQNPADSQHLLGHPGFKRIDQGEYRIIYYLNAGSVRIAVVGKRNDDAAYKKSYKSTFAPRQ